MQITDILSPAINILAAPTRAPGTMPLAAFLDALSPMLPRAVPTVEERQPDATPGKPLPEDADTDAASPWLATLLMPGTTPPAPPATPISEAPHAEHLAALPPVPAIASGTAASIVGGAIPSEPGNPIHLPPTESMPNAVAPVQDCQEPIAAAPITDGVAKSTDGDVKPPLVSVVGENAASPSVRTFASKVMPTTSNELAPTAILRAGAAREVFADALAREPAPRRRAEATGDAGASTLLATAAPIAVAKVGETVALQPTDGALHKMIDHIERLRDDADASDTRIRLKPDMLGAIDVAVRQEGERVHVHFSAEAAATRGILIDAQPRLETLAAERGLSLAGSSVGGGDARQRPAPVIVAPQSLRPAATAIAPADTIDLRLA